MKGPSPLRLRPQLLALAVASCFATAPALGGGPLPTGASNLVGIQAQNIVYGTNSLSITTSAARSAADWASFSIGAGNRVDILQPTASSAMLNRVLASDPSRIYGTLSSNGQVFLINQAGIQVGPGGMIDTARFVASTLNLSPEDFMAGRLNFQATPGAGSIVNQGTINTPAGGSVYLIAPNVSNEGLIHSPNGEVILAAGQTVSLIDTATPGVRVDITGSEGNATNLGTITAEAGRIGIAGVLVRNSGTLNASSVVNDGGRIFLKATGDTLVEGGKLQATSAGGHGGQIDVLGDRVAVFGQAEIDVSGASGGGQIRVGGDYQGKNPDIQNASNTYFGADAQLKADATESGPGGTVIVWADDTTRAYGSISVRGGGSGGFIETSGHHLDVEGIRVRAGGIGGAGLWLLDPNDVTIYHNTIPFYSNITNVTPFVPVDGNSPSVLSDYLLNQAINGGASVLVTTAAGSGGQGYITFDGSSGTGNGPIVIDKTSNTFASTLTFNAHYDIAFVGATTFKTSPGAAALNVVFNPASGRKISLPYVTSAVTFDGQGGAVNVSVVGDISTKYWENYGTVNLLGASLIDLNDGVYDTAYINKTGGVTNINSSQNWSFLSSSGSQSAPIDNFGTINVNANTSWEAKYSNLAGGVLNIAAAKDLSMQNGDLLSGTFNIGSGARLILSQDFGGAQTFNAATINGPGSVAISPTVGAILSNSSVNGATIDIGAGATLAYVGSQTFSNATVQSHNAMTLPTAVSYIGNAAFLATGSLVQNPSSSTIVPGNLTLVAGWDGTTPASSIAGTSDATGLAAGITGALVFNGGSNVNAGGGMTLKATADIDLLAGAGGVSVVSAGAQKLYAKGDLIVQGSATQSMSMAELRSSASQAITASSISVMAADAAGIHDSQARIVALGDQQINVGTAAPGAITIWSGTSMQDSGSYNNQAEITHGVWGGGSFSGNQTITLGNGSTLSVTAGKGSSLLGFADSECQSGCAGAHNSATLSNYFGNMSINTPAGGSIGVFGGSVGNNNWAGIESQTSGTLTIGTPGSAPTIAIIGGASGGSIGVKLPAYGGGINYNSNDASVSSDGTLVVNASSVVLNAPGVAGTYAAAYLGAPVTTVNTTGNLSLNGGSGNSALPTTLSTPAAIGHEQNASIMLNVGGNLSLAGGAGNGAMAMIGSLFGTANVTINGAGTVGMGSASAGADRIGSLLGSGGAIAINSAGSMALGTGLIQTGTGALDSVTLTTSNQAFSQAAGGSILGRNVSIITGSGAVTQPVGASITALNLTASGNGLSFLGNNAATNVMLVSTGAGNITYRTTADTHIALATASSGTIDIATLAPASIGLGTLTTTANGNVVVNAAGAILDDNGGAANVSTGSGSISLTSTLGGAPGQWAISADTSTTGSLSAAVGGSYGGISVRNTAAASPSAISLTDSAAAGNRVAFSHAGSDLMLNAGHYFEVGNGGDLAITASGNMTLAGGPFIYVPSSASSVLLGAVRTMDFGSGNTFSLPNNDLALVAAAVTVGANSAIDAKNLGIITGTLTVTGPATTLTAANDVLLVAGNVVLDKAGIIAANGMLHAAIANDVRLNDGAHLDAPNGKVRLVFTNPSSTLYLNDANTYPNPSYIKAAPSTVELVFLARASGGVVLDGDESLITLPGASGFYTGGPPGSGTPLLEHHGLEVDYRANTAIDPGVIKDLVDRNGSNTPPLPPPLGGRYGEDLKSANGGTVGGGEGEFGGKEGDKKDDKDKNARGSDRDKKDEKDAHKKPVANCGT